jgi:hypothetical protein
MIPTIWFILTIAHFVIAMVLVAGIVSKEREAMANAMFSCLMLLVWEVWAITVLIILLIKLPTKIRDHYKHRHLRKRGHHVSLGYLVLKKEDFDDLNQTSGLAGTGQFYNPTDNPVFRAAKREGLRPLLSTESYIECPLLKGEIVRVKANASYENVEKCRRKILQGLDAHIKIG